MSRNSILGFVAALAIAGGMWCYAHYVLVPMQKSYAVAHGIPRGNLSDLYPRWLGARELLRNGKDPYSPEITHEIQTGYYGRPLDEHHPYDPKDQAGFAYPVYVVFLLAPTVLLPFSMVQAMFYWLFIGVITGTVILWFKGLHWPPRRLTLFTAITLGLGNFPAIQSLALRQLTILVAGFLALAFVFTVRRKFVFAGVLLALATIKPQLAIPMTLWLALWTLSGWRARKGLLFGFLGSIAILVACAQLVLPGWLVEFYRAVIAYRKYTGGATAADVLFGAGLGRAANILLVLITGIICWQLRRESEKSIGFCFASCFVLAVTVAFDPIFAPYNQLLLFPAYLFLIQHRDALRPRESWQKAILGIALLMICWQWMACIGLAIVYRFLPAKLLERAWAMPFYVSLLLPIVIMCLLYVCLQGVVGRESQTLVARTLDLNGN